MNPYIVSRPANEIQVQKLGDTVRLNCSAGGSPPPKIIWLTDGRIVHSLVVHGGIDYFTMRKMPQQMPKQV